MLQALRSILVGIAVVLLAVGAVGSFGMARAVGPTVNVESASLHEGESVTVYVTGDFPSPGILSFRVDIVYDPGLVTPTGCASYWVGVCEINVTGPNEVRINGSTLSGISGSSAYLGEITFVALPGVGTSPLHFKPSTLFALDMEGDPVTLNANDGMLTVHLPPVGGVVSLQVSANEGSGPNWSAIPLILIVTLAGLAFGVKTHRRLRRRG